MANALNSEWVNKLTLKQNPNFHGKDGSPKSLFDHVVEFSKSAYGTFRLSQLLDRVLRAAAIVFEAFNHPWHRPLIDLSKPFKVASNWLALPRLPEVFYKAGQSIINWAQKPKKSISIVRDRMEKMGTLFDATATAGFAAAAIATNPLIAQVAGVPDLARYIIDLSGMVEDYTAAKRVHDFSKNNLSVKSEIVQNIEYTMRHKMITIAKTIISIVTTVLGLLVLSFGGPVLPAAVLLVIGIAGSILTLWGHFYKETTRHHIEIPLQKISIEV